MKRKIFKKRTFLKLTKKFWKKVLNNKKSKQKKKMLKKILPHITAVS